MSVLRDTLGDDDPINDRVIDVWLLGYAEKTWTQRALAAVPFFYWRVGRSGSATNSKSPKPLMDLTAPMHPVISNITRNLVQWTAFDPLTSPVRASTRAYRTNELDDQRLHLERAITLLEQAPSGPGEAQLTRPQVDTVIARLDLRKQILGGLVSDTQAPGFAERSRMAAETVRSRNWELLRQSAEKTGLFFEPLPISGSEGEYGILWFPLGRTAPNSGTNVGPMWKLLNIRDPWQDSRLRNWEGSTFERMVDENGALLPVGDASGKPVTLVPLAVYSLLYAKSPLLMTDFRRTFHIRTHEMLQRSITEVTSGVIGISHFTNWYYYAGAAAYDFIASRHGKAMDQAARRDCYAQFRLRLALDSQLDPSLRAGISKQAAGMDINPLGSAPGKDSQSAYVRYAALEDDLGESGHIAKYLQAQRRAELASFGRSRGEQALEAALHSASFGLYRSKAPAGPEMVHMLDRNRRLLADLDFLQAAVANGTDPEVSNRASSIREAIAELAALLPDVRSSSIRKQARMSLEQVQKLTRNEQLQAECSGALATMNGVIKPVDSVVAASDPDSTSQGLSGPDSTTQAVNAGQ